MFVKFSILLIFLVVSFASVSAQITIEGETLGIINGRAIYLPKPEYPQEAADFCAGGKVEIKVLIGEKGEVLEAEAISGNVLLRAVSVKAVKKAKFTPAMSGAVRFKGIVVYNFDSLAKCISGGIVNKKAVELPQPQVPNLGKPHLQLIEEQIVGVWIIVEPNGKVSTARAVSGHPLLRAACVNAARQTKFSPINGYPIRVKALLVYKFKPDGSVETNIENDDKAVIGTPVNLVEPPPPFCNCSFGTTISSVSVEAKTDEQGNVTKAKSFSGHPVLRKISEKAALESKFLPTDIRAKIRINYNFESSDDGRTAKIKNIEIKKVEIYEKDSGEIVVGKAVDLVKPPFPSGFGGKLENNASVLIEAKIDENGNVVSAKAISGHPVLRAVCVQAARFSKFSPTTISGVPAKAKALITYEYILDDEFSVNIIVNGVNVEDE